MVTRVDEHIGFGNSVADGAIIPSFTSALSGVPTNISGDATLTLDFLGDFEGSLDGFSINIEGFDTGLVRSLYEYQADTATFTISQSTWAAIISDGVVNISYTLGTDTQEGTFNYGIEEYLRLTITWDDTTTPSKPQPNRVTGTDGADWLPGTSGRDIVDGRAGNDSIFAGHADDIVNGGAGDDVIGGGTGADVLRGDAGNDTIFGGNGNDFIYGGDGNDVAWGGRGVDMIRGDTGDDVLGGGLGRDALYGGDGADTLYGGVENDRLFGDAGDDTLFGGDGDDDLTGGLGDDMLWGGLGSDTFIFGKNEGNDVVGGFNAKDGDRIDIGSQSYTVSENDQGFAVLELSGGGTITLNGTGMEDITPDWFLMA